MAKEARIKLTKIVDEFWYYRSEIDIDGVSHVISHLLAFAFDGKDG